MGNTTGKSPVEGLPSQQTNSEGTDRSTAEAAEPDEMTWEENAGTFSTPLGNRQAIPTFQQARICAMRNKPQAPTPINCHLCPRKKVLPMSPNEPSTRFHSRLGADERTARMSSFRTARMRCVSRVPLACRTPGLRLAAGERGSWPRPACPGTAPGILARSW